MHIVLYVESYIFIMCNVCCGVNGVSMHVLLNMHIVEYACMNVCINKILVVYACTN